MNWMRNLVLLNNNYWKRQTDNNKTLILFFYWLKTVTPCSKFCINITHLNESEALITVMSEFLFCEGFSLGHVIITTIIMRKSVSISHWIRESMSKCHWIRRATSHVHSVTFWACRPLELENLYMDVIGNLLYLIWIRECIELACEFRGPKIFAAREKHVERNSCSIGVHWSRRYRKMAGKDRWGRKGLCHFR